MKQQKSSPLAIAQIRQVRMRKSRKPQTIHDQVSALIASRLSATDRDFRYVAEAMPHIVWTGRADGTIDYMNSRWFEYTGLSEEDTYNETGTAVHPDDLDQYRLKWKEAARTKNDSPVSAQTYTLSR